MQHEQINRRSRVWIVTRGPDGRLTEGLNPDYLATLEPAHAHKLVRAVGELEIAKTRVW
jgi:hypothetical protein